MTTKRVVCTNRDNTVAVLIPAPECLERLKSGGPLDTTYLDRTGLKEWVFIGRRCSLGDIARFAFTGRIPPEIAREWEIAKFVRDPQWRPDLSEQNRERLAACWIDSLVKGGLNEHESIRLITEKDAPAWSTAHEIVEASDLPDRWFRNAWRRSHNGGPITVNLEAARQIQFLHIRRAVKAENARRDGDIESFDAPIDPDWNAIRAQIKAASDENELRRIWQAELSRLRLVA